MDPFTQRMLERARARREKLDTQLSNAGHDVKKHRSPLKDANAILEKAPTITKPQKQVQSPVKNGTVQSIREVEKSPEKSPRKSTPKTNDRMEHQLKENQERGDKQISNVKSKLQRLGKLYSDDNNRELSSPIHRTEEKFAAEETYVERKPVKVGARLDRLAALASTINNWEDDLSHPTLVKPTDSKAEKIQAKINDRVKNAQEPQPSTSGFNSNTYRVNGNKETSGTKQLKWDKTVLETLGSKGKSPSKTIKEDAESVTDSKENSKAENSSSLTGSPTSNSSKSSDAGTSKTPDRAVNKNVSSNNHRAGNARFGYNGSSPKNSALQSSPGSVLSKASMFESKNMNVKTKDPAEMTLSERMALFERNKGEAPLLPKAPLTMSVPTKKLMEKSNSPKNQNDRLKETPKTAVGVQKAIFEQGGQPQELENNILRNAQMERQRELEMLRSRFNRNKQMAQAAAGSCIRTSESSEGKPNSPKNSPVCPVKPTPASDQNQVVPPAPPLPSHRNEKNGVSIQSKMSPSKRQVAGSPPKIESAKLPSDIKRIRVSPPKPGHLYPNLEAIDVTETETETESGTEYTVGSTEPETATLDEQSEETGTEGEYYVNQNNDNSDYDSTDETDDIVNTSLGRSILRAVNHQTILNKKRSIEPDPDSTTSDISVLDEMDEYLDECLAVQEAQGINPNKEEGPTPPKLNRAGKSPSAPSTSFKYMQGSSYRSPIKVVTPKSSPRKQEQYVVEGDNCVPLMHSVSFYRRQQSQTPKTPVRLVSRIGGNIDSSSEEYNNGNDRNETALVQDKIKRLLDEICKQQTIIGQASQALNLCNATVEFSGSREQVEGERLLLLATHRRQAALNEVQRLKVEGTLRPVVPGAPEIQESGSLTISAITLPLKREYFRNVDNDTRLHFVCMVRHLENIVATPVVVAESGDSCLRFPSTLKLQDLYSDFKITIEVYSLQTDAEVLPHEIKYHINSGSNAGNGVTNSGKKASGKTPKKFSKQESRLIMPTVQSPAGPSAVRSPAFSLSGYVVFSLKEVHRQQFTLNKVPRQSPLEGRLQMHVSCELSVSVEHRGFLTMFEDVSGFGAWHRRWCLLKGATLSYWKYPDDERKKTPIGSLDLQGVTTNVVGLVSRDICARPNTILLETSRPAQPGDTESLVTIRNGSQTVIRHLLSADTKEERLEWSSKFNKTLSLIRAWGGTSSSTLS